MTNLEIEWDVHLDNGKWLGKVQEKIATDRRGQEPDEYARCAAVVIHGIPASKGFSVSPRSLSWDEVDDIQSVAFKTKPPN